MSNEEEDHGYAVKTRQGLRPRERPQSAEVCLWSQKKREVSSQVSKSAGRLRNQSVNRQNSNFISTDTSGAAIKTINNILSGITESVNRLTDLQYRVPTKAGSGTAHTVKVDHQNQFPRASEQVLKPPVVKIRALRKKVKALSTKLSTINSSFSNCSVKKTTKMSGKMNEKKIQKEKPMERLPTAIIETVTAAPVKKKLKPFTKPQFGNPGAPNRPFELSPHKLVEIYHNNAAKESDSEEEKNKSKIQVKMKTDAVPHLNISGQDCGDYRDVKRSMNEEGYEEPHAPRTCYTNKSYELPTIASKMKQAVKLDFNMFNFKAIPFCPVSSTTPSHNIGINIQQVMSIIKTRQPVQGISPTLAHNINLAAEKLNHDPLTSFVSSMTSKMGYGKSNCPLNKYSLNYRHLEEMARTVPEEAIDENDEMANASGGNAAGPSGDMQMRSPPGPHQWTTDNSKRSCTCAPQIGVDFNHVYNKYRTQPSQYDHKNHYNRRPPATANPLSKNNGYAEAASRKIRSMGYVDTQYQQNSGAYMQENVSPMNGNDKNLKDVLMNLHDDFEAMNKRYEVLSTQASAGEATQEDLEELEELEQQLNRKEEEITIVMTLYKEVLTLKQQVKALRRCSAENNIYRPPRPDDYSSKTAQHISKLLNQINQYHTYHRIEKNGYNMYPQN